MVLPLRQVASTWRKVGQNLFICALLSGVPACVGPTLIVQQYAGPVRPRSTVAILRVNGREPVVVLELDRDDLNVPLADDSRLHVEMLPGRHTVSATDKRSGETFHEPAAFDAEAGKVYRVVVGPAETGAGAGGDVHVFEVNGGSDALVRDVTVKRVTPPVPEVPSRPPGASDGPVGDTPVEGTIDAGATP